jgi:rhodanese-related sulfurtransferase
MPHSPYAGDILPQQAWEILNANPQAVLIDVRTPPEWQFVGIPDLSSLGRQPLFVPWALYPAMEINRDFAAHVAVAAKEPDAPLLFLCRSGGRSRSAAVAMTAAGYQACYNIAGGFEGDPDAQRHRGTLNGWKVDGLPWLQG